MARATKRSGGGRGKARGKDTEQEAPRVDAVLGELEAVVDELESGELPLEEALARFEVGVKLAKDGATMLDAMERRVEVLLADDDGGVTASRFEAESVEPGEGNEDEDDEF